MYSFVKFAILITVSIILVASYETKKIKTFRKYASDTNLASTRGSFSLGKILNTPAEKEADLSKNQKSPRLRQLAGSLLDHFDAFYHAPVKVGNPYNDFLFAVDTGSSDTWLASKHCSSEACKDKNLYDSSQSSAYEINGTKIELKYVEQRKGKLRGFLSSDEMTWLGDWVTVQQTFTEATELSGFENFKRGFYDGVLGLGFQSESTGGVPTVYSNMLPTQQNKLFCAFHDRDRTNGQLVGNLLFDSIDDTFIEGNLTYTPLTSDSFWQVRVDQLSLGERSFCDEKAGCQARLAIGTARTYGPKAAVAQANHQLNATQTESGAYLLPDCTLEGKPDFLIKVEGREFKIKAQHYVLQVSTGECYSSFYPHEGDEEHWIFGNTIIGTLFTIFDYKTKEVAFAVNKYPYVE